MTLMISDNCKNFARVSTFSGEKNSVCRSVLFYCPQLTFHFGYRYGFLSDPLALAGCEELSIPQITFQFGFMSELPSDPSVLAACDKLSRCAGTFADSNTDVGERRATDLIAPSFVSAIFPVDGTVSSIDVEVYTVLFLLSQLTFHLAFKKRLPTIASAFTTSALLSCDAEACVGPHTDRGEIPQCAEAIDKNGILVD